MKAEKLTVIGAEEVRKPVTSSNKSPSGRGKMARTKKANTKSADKRKKWKQPTAPSYETPSVALISCWCKTVAAT